MSFAIDQYTAALEKHDLPAHWQFDIQIRPRRRTLSLSLQPGSKIVMAVPPDMPPERAAAFVGTKRDAIARKLTEAAKANAEAQAANVGKRLVDGETFELLGTSYRLKLVDDGPSAVRDVTTGELLLRRGTPAALQHAVLNWYVREGLAWARQVGATFEHRGAITNLNYVVRDIGRTRWGVYRRKPHQVEFAWQLFQLPETLVRYVVVHELAHATRPAGTPHGPAFQRVMDLWLPGHRKVRKRLGDAGQNLWRGSFADVDRS